MTFNPKWIKSTEVIKRDGTNALTGDWNVGDKKKIILDFLQIQDVDGFTIIDETAVSVFHINGITGDVALKKGSAVNEISNNSSTDSTSSLLTSSAIHELILTGTSGSSGSSGNIWFKWKYWSIWY